MRTDVVSHGACGPFLRLVGSWATLPADEERAKERVPQTVDERVDRVTVREWGTEYIAMKSAEGLKPASLSMIRSTVRSWQRWGGDRTLGSLTYRDGVDYVAWLRGRPGRTTGSTLSKMSVSKHVTHVKASLEIAQRVYPGFASPWILLPSGQPKVRPYIRYITMAEFDRLLAACCGHRGLRAYLSLCRLAGLRKNEAERLRWREIDLPARAIHIVPPSGEADSKHRERIVPIRDRLAIELAMAANEALPTPVVLPRRQTTNGKFYSQVLYPIYARAGIHDHTKVLQHLRASARRDWANAGINDTDLNEIMGHSGGVASGFYMRVDADVARRASRM